MATEAAKNLVERNEGMISTANTLKNQVTVNEMFEPLNGGRVSGLEHEKDDKSENGVLGVVETRVVEITEVVVEERAELLSVCENGGRGDKIGNGGCDFDKNGNTDGGNIIREDHGGGDDKGSGSENGLNLNEELNDDEGVLIKTQVVETEIVVQQKYESLSEGSFDAKLSENGSDFDEKAGLDRNIGSIVVDAKGPLGNKNGIVDIRNDNGDAPDEGLVLKNQVVKGSSFSECKDKTENGNGFVEKVEFNENGISLVVDVQGHLNSDENAIGEKIEIGEARSFTAETSRKITRSTSKKGENYEGDLLESAGGEHVYLVGDFVWSKFNSHPWWPARIYDPSDASDRAKKFSYKKGQWFLVAYFGDGSYSWRSPSQLKPFSENFDELSKKNDSTNFLKSVQDALDEIGRVAELAMTCSCIPEEHKAGLVRNTVNTGIREGVVAPTCDIRRLHIHEYEPAELLSTLRSISMGKAINNMLELTALRSFVSAFYCAKGGQRLVSYQEPLVIEGLEDREKNRARGVKNKSVMQRCSGLFEDKLEKKRKSKSVASLLNDDNAVKNKVLVSENGFDESVPDKTHDEVNDGGASEEKARETSASRERKKSKYLSPPFTDSNLSFRSFGKKRDFIEAEAMKASKIARVGERMASAATKLTELSPILKSSDKKSKKEPSGKDGNLLEEQIKKVEPFKVEASSEEVVNGARSLAVDPISLLGTTASGHVVKDFVCAYRDATYAKGACCKTGNKSVSGRKRKASNSEPAMVVENGDVTLDYMTIAEFKRARKMENVKAKSITSGEVYGSEDLVFVKQKLEEMAMMVEKSDASTYPEMKVNLETEMKGLVNKVNAMMSSTSA